MSKFKKPSLSLVLAVFICLSLTAGIVSAAIPISTNKNVNLGKVVVADTSQEVLSNLKKHFPEVEFSDTKGAASQNIVFIALHPPVPRSTRMIACSAPCFPARKKLLPEP